MCVSVLVYNPNKFKITVKKANAESSLNNKPIGDLIISEKVKLDPKNETEISFAINTTKEKLATSFLKSLDFFLGKKLSFQLEGKLKVKAFGVGFNVPIDEKYELDYRSLLK